MPQVLERRVSVAPTALRFRGNLALFSAEVSGPPDAQTIPCKLKVRSPDPVTHWYWGRVIHDMSGAILPAKCVIDWEHEEVLGYADQFTVTETDGLAASGVLVPFGDDLSREIAHKAALGVPYQASISFDGEGVVVEWVPEGETQLVNGQEFAGPGYVVREWPLMAIAICKQGVDTNTAATFSADAAAASGPALPVVIRGPHAGPMMSQSPTTNPAPFTREDAARELGKFSTLFGPEAGTKHFSEGRSLLEAFEIEWNAVQSRHAAELSRVKSESDAALEKLRAEHKQLSDQLEAAKKLSAGQGLLSGAGEPKDNGQKRPLVKIAGRAAS